MVRSVESTPGQNTEQTRTIKGRIIDGSDRQLWRAAKEEDLLPKIIQRGFLLKEEIDLLGSIFATKGKRGNQPKVPDELFEKFSIAVANTTV